MPAELALDERDLSYFAGVIDLVGAISVRRVAMSHLPVVSIYGKYPDVMSILSEATATRTVVTSRGYLRAGCAEHCREKHQHVSSVSARWQLTGAKATIMLWNIVPYMKTQHIEAHAAIQRGLISNYKTATIKKMADLGWQIPPEMERKIA